MAIPRISLNKLGEYLTASPSRRKRIIQDQQDPKPFIVARYSDAREAIISFMSSGMLEVDDLSSEAKKLRLDDGGSAFSSQDRLASAEAIENFIKTSDQIDVSGLIIVPVVNSSSETMKISGVNVSVRPDAYLKNIITGDIVGAVKLHFPKTTPLNKVASEYVATALRVYLEQKKGSIIIDPKKCYVVDVSTSSVTHAPKTYKKNMNDISAACEEIEARWLKNHLSSS